MAGHGVDLVEDAHGQLAGIVAPGSLDGAGCPCLPVTEECVLPADGEEGACHLRAVEDERTQRAKPGASGRGECMRSGASAE
eukprot:5225535-Heterocapsa_arctica.AAC.1